MIATPTAAQVATATKQIRAFLKTRHLDPFIREDLAQDALIKWLGTFRKLGRGWPWLSAGRAWRNECRRRRRARPERESDNVTARPATRAPIPLEWLPDLDQARPDERVEARQELARSTHVELALGPVATASVATGPIRPPLAGPGRAGEPLPAAKPALAPVAHDEPRSALGWVAADYQRAANLRPDDLVLQRKAAALWQLYDPNGTTGPGAPAAQKDAFVSAVATGSPQRVLRWLRVLPAVAFMTRVPLSGEGPWPAAERQAALEAIAVAMLTSSESPVLAAKAVLRALGASEVKDFDRYLKARRRRGGTGPQAFPRNLRRDASQI